VQAALQQKLPPHFDYLEQQLGQREFFVGNQLSMADIAVACQLINMAHGGEQLDAQRWPGLAAHHARMLALPSVASVLPDEQRMNAKLKEMGKAATA